MKICNKCEGERVELLRVEGFHGCDVGLEIFRLIASLEGQKEGWGGGSSSVRPVRNPKHPH